MAYIYFKIKVAESLELHGVTYDLPDRFWSAYVDGKKVKIHRANFTFKAIELPAGTHTVSWMYNPFPIKTAYSIFYILLIVFSILFFLYRRRFLD